MQHLIRKHLPQERRRTTGIMRKGIMLPVIAVAVLVPAGSASAHYCGIADKPASAGAIEGEPTFNKGGNLVARGAFIQVGDETGASIFVRGGEGHPTDKPWQSTGSGNLNAIANGPSDHGMVEVLDDSGP